MREIRVRAKCIEEGEHRGQWITGFGVHIFEGDEVEAQLYTTEGVIAVDPATVGQYTGRTTYDETPIYRGDKLQFVTFNYDGSDNGIQTGYVEWSEENATYVVVDEDREKEYWMYLVLGNDDGVEVIGNRWDTPEGRT